MAPDDDYEAGDVNTVDDVDDTNSSDGYEDGDVNTVSDAGPRRG